jgi:hypothetical protein
MLSSLFVSMLAVAVFLFPALCVAQAAKASPFDQAFLITYVWIVAIACLGGAAAFYRKMLSGHARPFNLTEFIGELFVSAFAGVITFWLCRWANVDDWLGAAFVGIAGHMGSRAIFMGEQLLERWFGAAKVG